MQVPLTVIARNAKRSRELDAAVRERVARLHRFFDRIISCRVALEGPGAHHQHGRHTVRIYIKVPTTVLVVNHVGDDDMHVAVRKAFDVATRRLEDYARRLRGDVKTPQVIPHGRISRLFPEGYGFIDAGGRDVYFHRHSVLPPGFDRLEEGAAVRFTEEPGESGPQASMVMPIGKASH